MKNQAVFQLLYCRAFSSCSIASTDLFLSLCKVPWTVHFLVSCSIRVSGSRVHISAEEFGGSLESNQGRAKTHSNPDAVLRPVWKTRWVEYSKGHQWPEGSSAHGVCAAVREHPRAGLNFIQPHYHKSSVAFASPWLLKTLLIDFGDAVFLSDWISRNRRKQLLGKSWRR